MECVDARDDIPIEGDEPRSGDRPTLYSTPRSESMRVMGSMFWDMGVVMIMMVPAVLPRSLELAALMGAFLILILPLLALMRVMTRFLPRPRTVTIDDSGISKKRGRRVQGPLLWGDEMQMTSRTFRQESSVIPVIALTNGEKHIEVQPAGFEHQGIPLLRDLENRMGPQYDRQLKPYLAGSKSWTSGKRTLSIDGEKIIIKDQGAIAADLSPSEILRIDFLPGFGKQLTISHTGGQCTLEELPEDWHLLLFALRTTPGLENKMHPRLDVIEEIGNRRPGNVSGLLIPLFFMQGMIAVCGLLALAMTVALVITHGVTPIALTAMGVQALLATYLCKRCFGYLKDFKASQKATEDYEAAYTAEVIRQDSDGSDDTILSPAQCVKSLAVEGRYAYDLSQITWLQLISWFTTMAVIGGSWWHCSHNNQSDIFGIPLMIVAPVAMVIIGVSVGRLLEAWIIKRSLAVIQTRSPRWIKNPSDAFYMDFMPRETWGKFKLETAKDTGPLFVDSEAQHIYWEAGTQRLAFPAAAITSCTVEEGGAQGGTLHVIALVLLARTPEGPQECCFCIRKEGKAEMHRKILQEKADVINSWLQENDRD